MEDNFNQSDFEEFLKQQVKSHRLYPNDMVWREINKKLHGDKKWPALTIAAFLLLSATTTICMYFTPKPDIFTINSDNVIKNSTLLTAQHSVNLDSLTPAVSLYKNKNTLSHAVKGPAATAVASPFIANTFEEVISKNELATAAEQTDKNDLIQTNTAALAKIDKEVGNSSVLANLKEEVPDDNESAAATLQAKKTVVPETVKFLAENLKPVKRPGNKNLPVNVLKEHAAAMSLNIPDIAKSKRKKWGFQVYIAPSISYRKLVEDKSILKEGANPGPVGLNYVADVNKVVRHKPGNGLEAGVGLLYYLSDKIRVKSGLQFNVRQYTIEAFRSNTEFASIALIENNRIDTVRTLAIYRNSNGNYPAELVNRYYQVAIPLGIEWEVIGNERFQLNIAGSIQPTYLFNHNSYLLSTNFKNYSENPDMVRSFNVNSNIETYISFKAGNFKWQIGPQIRYQPYSTFIPQYPIKEHLWDYGVKIGVSKTF